MEPTKAQRVPEPVERFVKQLLVAFKAAKLYPPASDIPRESAADVLVHLRALLQERSGLRFQVTRDGFVHDGLPVLHGNPAFEHFAREFYNRHLAEVRFHAGVTEKEVIDFLRTLQGAPEEIDAAGGFEQRLWDQQVDNITVKAVATKVVDTGSGGGAPALADGEAWPPPDERIEEIIGSGHQVGPRDQRMLARFLASPPLVARYLRDLASSDSAGQPLSGYVAGRITALARVVMNELAEDQPELFRSIAEGVLGLEPELRGEVLAERLLPESRMDEAVAGVLHQMELGELCQALAEGMGTDAISRDGLARAIRNLAAISLQPKEEVFEAARLALKGSGFDEGTVAGVLEGAAPVELKVEERPAANGQDPIESIIRLTDLAPVAEESTDPAVSELRAEVRDGISDGDILLAVVTLATAERRPQQFAALMSMIEDGLGLLLEWGEYIDAADAAEALTALHDDETLDEGQRHRVLVALEAMTGPKYMRQVSAAMRIHSAGTLEHEACRRLLGTLGNHTIGPLLEVLADEPDMAARKALVDTISGIAAGHVGVLAERITDSRWYFVRNVVSILGSTRAPEALTHLNRTLRHPDARVRRETIRALSGIRERMAEEMLAATLADSDAQNVGLAARYLGTIGSRGAVTALAAVARGEGSGNREIGPRVEAIEALGRVGGPDAVATLRELQRERGGIMRAGRNREIRAAAAAALAEIERSSRGGDA